MANLGRVLLQRKYINLIQLNLALDFQVFYGNRLGTNLLELGIITEKQLCEALGESLGLPFVLRGDLEKIPKNILQRFSREDAYHFRAIPFKVSGSQLHVAMENPADDKLVAAFKKAHPGTMTIHVAPELLMCAFLSEHYQIPMEPRLEGIWAKYTGPDAKIEPAVSPSYPEKNATRPDRWINDDEDRLYSAQEKPSKNDKVVLSVQKISLMLDEAQTRDEIARLILQFSEKYLKRAALFVMRRDFGFGWDGCGEGIIREHIKGIVIPLEELSIFRTLMESQGHILGEVPRTPINDQFFRALGGKRPKNILLLPLTVGGITFGALYGDNLTTEVDSNSINELQVMIARANIAFQRLIIVERQKAVDLHTAAL